MKIKIFFLVAFLGTAAVIISGCRDEIIRYQYCWHCEVREINAAEPRIVDTCTLTDNPPVFISATGDSLLAACEKK